MTEKFTESSPDTGEISPEEATQEIIMSAEEPDKEVVAPPPQSRLSFIRNDFADAGASVVDFLRLVVGSKAGLAVTAGIFAAFMTAIGFAVFDAGREQWMLEQKYPDAINADERYLFHARDLMNRGHYADAKSILQDLLKRGGGDGLHADAQFELGTCLLKSGDDEAAARAGRRALEEFAEAFPTDRRVPAAHRLIAESFAKGELYDDSTARYKRLLRMLPEKAERGEIEFLIAKNLYDADNLTAARMALKELRQKYAGTPIAHDSTILLGKMLIKYGRFDAADEVLRELVQQAPRTAHAGEAMVLMAKAAAERGEYARAIGYCEEWFKHSPTSQDELDTMLLLAQAKLETGAPEETISLASEVFMSYRESPRLARAGILMGRAYEELKDLEKAESYYHSAAEMDPTNWEPHWRLSRLRSFERAWPEAIELMKHATELTPDNEFLLLELTKLYRLNGDEATAFSILDRYTRERQLSPQIQEAYLMLADIHRKRGALRDAYRTLERLEAIGATTTDLSAVYDRQGDILNAAALHGEAIEKYRMAVEKGADKDTQNLKIARMLLADGKTRQCLEKLTGIEPSSLPLGTRFDYFDVKAHALLKLERYAEARAAIIAGIDLRSGRENFSTLASLMQASLELGDDAAASDVYELTLKLIETDNPESQAPSESRHIILGWARHLYNNGEYARAAEAYSRVGTPRFPVADAAWALYQRGNCHFHMAEYDQASEFYSRLAAEFTDSEWVTYAEAKEQLIGAGAGS